jgi:hypothetical protein
MKCKISTWIHKNESSYWATICTVQIVDNRLVICAKDPHPFNALDPTKFKNHPLPLLRNQKKRNSNYYSNGYISPSPFLSLFLLSRYSAQTGTH